MDLVHTIAEVRSAVAKARAQGRTVGFVPTMGALHEGHLSLMRHARRDTGFVVLSVFVNPTQFGPGEDYQKYPRTLARDAEMAQSVGVDLVFAPEAAEMYPPGATTRVNPGPLGSVLEGAVRPGHFEGVCTVCAKLFNIVRPDVACFGRKDFQQALIIRRMVRDLDMPLEIRVLPTVREPDGLAMSSRNAYLTAEERAAAPVIHRALRAGADAVLAGERDPEVVRALVAGLITAEPLAALDYAAVVDARTLDVVDPLVGDVRLLAAAKFGRARLLDNLGVTTPTG